MSHVGPVRTGSTPAVWRLSVTSALPFRFWDGEIVVYNPLSGDTHMLDVLTSELLRVLMGGPADVAALRRATAVFLDVPDNEQVAQHVGQALASLDELGLIELATC